MANQRTSKDEWLETASSLSLPALLLAFFAMWRENKWSLGNMTSFSVRWSLFGVFRVAPMEGADPLEGWRLQVGSVVEPACWQESRLLAQPPGFLWQKKVQPLHVAGAKQAGCSELMAFPSSWS